jgi:cyclophilin family peptidyl-prolyl cis-trans isomerase
MNKLSCKFFSILALLCLAFTVSANTRVVQEVQIGVKPSKASAVQSTEIPLTNNPKVEFNTTAGVIVIELFPDKAPITVQNFLSYVESGYYNNTIFHRVIPNLLIQGGAYTPNLQLKTDKGFIHNEATNGLSNRRGTISAARRSNDSESASSQFFFNVVDNPQFDFNTSSNMTQHGYTVFGQVILGQEIIDSMRLVATEHKAPLGDNVPKTPLIITKARKLD